MKKIIKNKKLLFCLTLLGILFSTSTALAFLAWPNSPIGTSLTEDSELPTLIQYLYEWGITLGGLAVFISLIIAGTQYLSSFGDPISMKNAMDRIKSAFLGLILLLSSWMILNTINPELTKFSPLTIPADGLSLGLCTNEPAEYCKENFGEGSTCKATDIQSSCETDSDCEEKHDNDYTCIQIEENSYCRSADKFCVTDFASQFEIKSCTSASVAITIDEGTPRTVRISPDSGCLSVSIARGASLTIESSPDDCVGYLELYPGGFWSNCGGDKQTIYLQKKITEDKIPDNINIKGVKMIKMETGF